MSNWFGDPIVYGQMSEGDYANTTGTYTQTVSGNISGNNSSDVWAAWYVGPASTTNATTGVWQVQPTTTTSPTVGSITFTPGEWWMLPSAPPRPKRVKRERIQRVLPPGQRAIILRD